MFRQFDFLGFYNQGDINDTVICHQNFNTLDINKAYTGLSYRCGSSYEFEIIVFINGTATSIRETLALALHHIRTATFQAFSPTDLGWCSFHLSWSILNTTLQKVETIASFMWGVWSCIFGALDRKIPSSCSKLKMFDTNPFQRYLTMMPSRHPTSFLGTVWPNSQVKDYKVSTGIND